jgi:hypothetical protein
MASVTEKQPRRISRRTLVKGLGLGAIAIGGGEFMLGAKNQRDLSDKYREVVTDVDKTLPEIPFRYTQALEVVKSQPLPNVNTTPLQTSVSKIEEQFASYNDLRNGELQRRTAHLNYAQERNANLLHTLRGFGVSTIGGALLYHEELSRDVVFKLASSFVKQVVFRRP